MALQKQEEENTQWYPLILGAVFSDSVSKGVEETLNSLDQNANILANEIGIKESSGYKKSETEIEALIEDEVSTSTSIVDITKKMENVTKNIDVLNVEESKIKREPRSPAIGMVIAIISMLFAGTSHKFYNTPIIVKGKEIKNFCDAISHLGLKGDEKLSDPTPQEIMQNANNIIGVIGSMIMTTGTFEKEFIGHITNFINKK